MDVNIPGEAPAAVHINPTKAVHSDTSSQNILILSSKTYICNPQIQEQESDNCRNDFESSPPPRQYSETPHHGSRRSQALLS